MTPYRCPTSCDEDCEINGWGCHEAHDVPSHREHDVDACEGRALAGNLRHLVDAGWQARFGRHPVPHAGLEWYYTELAPHATIGVWIFHGVSPGEAVFRAREWAESSGIRLT